MRARLLSRRAYGFHTADAVIALIYLCCADIQITLSSPLSHPQTERRAE